MLTEISNDKVPNFFSRFNGTEKVIESGQLTTKLGLQLLLMMNPK